MFIFFFHLTRKIHAFSISKPKYEMTNAIASI